MTFQQITASIPSTPDEGGADREWICFLACGHEARLQGRVGRPPKKGRAFAVCRLCEQHEECNEVPDGYWDSLAAVLENAPVLVEEPETGEELEPLL